MNGLRFFASSGNGAWRYGSPCLSPTSHQRYFQERLLETNRIEGEMAALGMRLHMTTESYSGPHHSAPHAEVREGEVGWLPTYQSMPRRVVFFPVRGNKDQARIFYEGESLDNLKRGHRYSLHSICRNEKDALEKILTRVKADLAREEQLRQRIEGRLAEIAAEEV